MPEIPVDISPSATALRIIRKKVEEKFGLVDVHPLEIAAEIGFDASLPNELRLIAAQTMLKYTMPTLKSIETKVDININERKEHVMKVSRELVDVLNGVASMKALTLDDGVDISSGRAIESELIVPNKKEG